MPHILPTSAMRSPARRLEITILFLMSLPGLLSRQKRYEMLYGAHTGRDGLIMCMIDSLLSFLIPMAGSRSFSTRAAAVNTK